MLRPEQLEVLHARASAGTSSAGSQGRVEECRYYGHDAVLHIRPDSAAGLAQAHEHTELLLARVHGEQALAVGTPVTVAAHGPATALG